MNNELLQHLTTPGAVAVMLIWLHSRLNKVESRIEMLAGHMNAPQPDKRKLADKLKVLWPVVIVALLLCGCTITRKCTKAGCTTNVGTSTNAVPILKELRKILPGY